MVAFDIERLRKDLITKRVIDGKLTLRQAAKEIGTSPATLSRIENSNPPDVETFARLCSWLGTNPADYIRKTGKRQDGFKANP